MAAEPEDGARGEDAEAGLRVVVARGAGLELTGRVMEVGVDIFGRWGGESELQHKCSQWSVEKTLSEQKHEGHHGIIRFGL